MYQEFNWDKFHWKRLFVSKWREQASPWLWGSGGRGGGVQLRLATPSQDQSRESVEVFRPLRVFEERRMGLRWVLAQAHSLLIRSSISGTQWKLMPLGNHTSSTGRSPPRPPGDGFEQTLSTSGPAERSPDPHS